MRRRLVRDRSTMVMNLTLVPDRPRHTFLLYQSFYLI